MQMVETITNYTVCLLPRDKDMEILELNKFGFLIWLNFIYTVQKILLNQI